MAIRAHLRSWVTVTLLLQAASLGALLPRHCCSAHDHEAGRRAATCHEAPAAVQCPMRGPDGEACPMHRSQAAAPETAPERCVMRGTCDGPMSAMVALLSQLGVLPSATSAPVQAGDTGVVVAIVLDPDRLDTPPDSPPPRA